MDTTPLKPVITIGKFQNIDMRVARILEASDPVDIPNPNGSGSKPCRVIRLDVGSLGQRTSVGQFALVPVEELVHRKVVICCNFAPRPMGDFASEALVLGTHHPASPADQSQAVPIYAHELSEPGDHIY